MTPARAFAAGVVLGVLVGLALLEAAERRR